MTHQRALAALVVVLRSGGVLLVLAFGAVLLPTNWMAVAHGWLGMGEFPAAPLTDYLARSVSAIYGFHGVLLFINRRARGLASRVDDKTMRSYRRGSPLMQRGNERGNAMESRFSVKASVFAAVVLLAVGMQAQQGGGRGPLGSPDIVGKWTGTWTSFNPAQATAQPRELCKKLDATVTKASDTVWTATFEGDCGRPYTYKISLEGRLVGGVVMFKGTVDLGAQDGGVFDWVGRGTTGEFIGFYTSAYSTGYFNLKKVPAGTDEH